jgi:hypothetical protein
MDENGDANTQQDEGERIQVFPGDIPSHMSVA